MPSRWPTWSGQAYVWSSWVLLPGLCNEWKPAAGQPGLAPIKHTTGSLCGTWWRRPSSITHALRICRCVRAPRRHVHDPPTHARLARASVAPLLLAGFTVPVPVHLRIGTVAKEVFRLRARRHLRAMGAAVAPERGGGGNGQTRGRGRGPGSAPWRIAGRRPGLHRLDYGCIGAVGHAGSVRGQTDQGDGP